MNKNTEEFIKRAREIHGDKYDYSQVIYEKMKTKVKIICSIHGEFWQTPGNHLKGSGCSKCSGKAKKTTEDFIEEAKEIHGDKYDYSQVEYKNVKTKVKIICLIHGEFWQTPDSHINGKRGCPKCGRRYEISQEDFIEEAEEVHGDKYDYSQVEYKNWSTKVKIICPIHGEFWQKPNNHIDRSHGCPYCGGRKLKTREQFIEEARKVHENKYDYSQVEYKNTDTKVKIICPIHGEFWQTPMNHLQGKGCSKCTGKEKKTTESFIKEIKKIHGDKYDYSLVEYKDVYTKVKIICPIHGEFWQIPNNHLQKKGCPTCNESHGERDIRIYLEENGFEYEYQKRFKDFSRYPYDFYIPSCNLLIEYDGQQHFEEVWEDLEIIQERDRLKNEYANRNEYFLLRIGYWENVNEILDYILKE